MVFDTPSIAAPFEERILAIAKMALPQHVIAVKHVKCIGAQHLQQFHDKIIKQKGEGVVLKHPLKKYEQKGRSKYTCCKLKVIHYTYCDSNRSTNSICSINKKQKQRLSNTTRPESSVWGMQK